MELSKEVQGLLERIRKLSQQAQKTEYYQNLPLNISAQCISMPVTSNYEIAFSIDDLISVETMDFSDNERWLYVSESSLINPFIGDLKQWLYEDFNKIDCSNSSAFILSDTAKIDSRKFIDTRTFTRPKKRINRPSLEQFADSCYTYGSSRSHSSDNFHETLSKFGMHSLSEDLSNDSIPIEHNFSETTPIHFKVSEPVSNSVFDKILATANDSIDSFQNMSPPSLMDSLCSSTFTTLMDSGYVNQDHVPNDNNDTFVRAQNEAIILNENNDPNVTYSNEYKRRIGENIGIKEVSLNDTFEIKSKNKSREQLNSSLSKLSERDINTFQKNYSNKNIDSDIYNLSGTRTITKKLKAGNLTQVFKVSCPDINRTYQKNQDCTLDLTFQKLSDSQPNLTEDLKRTILNQSMELMHPTETYHSARSGSADSLDERSSSISNSSKESGSKIFHMGDLENLARVQEQRLQHAMSTPNHSKKHFLLLEGNVISPIPNPTMDEDYLSDSDLSDTCLSARSRLSKPSSPARSTTNVAVCSKSEINTTCSKTLSTKPEMIVKPLEINRTMIQPNRVTVPQNFAPPRPKLRSSGLPRPAVYASTGIPRPASKIPGPKSLRSTITRPIQRQPPKADWTDGCY